MIRATVFVVLAAVLLGGHQVIAQDIDDSDILNFALNLECLEAEFYSWAAFGHGLSSEDLGGGPKSVGGKKALLSAAGQAYAAQIATDEINHVEFLRKALGSKAVPCPAINIGSAFSDAANAALSTTLKPALDVYGSDAVFLLGAFIFEDVGVTAYKGAARLIANKDYLEAAAGIEAVEAYHAGIIRDQLIYIIDQYLYPYGATVGVVANAISALRDVLDGPGKSDAGILANYKPGSTVDFSKITLVPTDGNSIAFSRNTSQVISIVTGGAKGGKGLFLPQGFNGKIK